MHQVSISTPELPTLTLTAPVRGGNYTPFYSCLDSPWVAHSGGAGGILAAPQTQVLV